MTQPVESTPPPTADGGLDAFETFDVRTADDVVLHGRHVRGEEIAVVLLHGHPRTHATWSRVAPQLAARGWSVVCPDLRGYGRSSGPAPDPEHEGYCDRAMADDVSALMRELGYPTWAVVGHDRGQGVAFRAAMDHPDEVTALAVLDGVPIADALERADARFAELWWHWFFFASPQAERVITADPLAWYRLDREAMGEESWADATRAVQDPRVVRAMLEDYRAGLHVDRRHAEQDRDDGRTVTCPTLVGWSVHDDMELLYGDPAAVWRPWCANAPETARIESGHHMAEQAPDQLAGVLVDFFRRGVAA